MRAAARPWVTLSSSSGATFEAVWRRLDPATRSACRGFFVDRDCRAEGLAKGLVAPAPVLRFDRPNFESGFLDWMARAKLERPVILLCGFFGIFSPRFLAECQAPVVNTHPSLLPAFPGLDKKVHKTAFETVSLSGFTVHLVNESLDGGPILFQHPVALDPRLNEEQNRERVREGEQRWLPIAFESIVRSGLEPGDRNRRSIDLRREHDLFIESFSTKDDRA